MKNPANTDLIFDISEALHHTNAFAQAVEYLQSIPEVAQLIRERYLQPTPNLDELMECSIDSLGYIYAITMKEANLDPEFSRKVEVEDDASYIILRMRQTHDIWRIITGFDTTGAGELALQSFMLAQCRLPLPVVLIAGGLLQSLKYPQALNSMMSGISKGWNLGLKTQPFLGQKWEEHWDKPVAIWRHELGVNAALLSI